MKTIIGHSHIQEYLATVLANKKQAHAYIFSGPAHVGKSTIAEWFINTLLCDDRCRIDIHKKHEQVYPDFYFIERESDKKNISVEQMRDLKASLSMTSLMNSYKVVVIDQAQFLNESSSNALLKVLEEPIGKTCIILLAEDESRILPTLRSRSVAVRFDLVSQQELSAYAQAHGAGYSKEILEQMVRMSQGRPGLLIHYLRNKEEFDILQKRIATLIDVLSSDLVARFAYIEEVQDKELVCADVEAIAHDCLAIKTNRPGNVILFSHIEQLRKLAERLSFEQIQSLMRQVIEFKKAQAYNVNQQLYLENIFAII